MRLNDSLSWDLHFYMGMKDFSLLPCLDGNQWSQPAFLPKQVRETSFGLLQLLVPAF